MNSLILRLSSTNAVVAIRLTSGQTNTTLGRPLSNPASLHFNILYFFFNFIQINY